GDRARPAAAAAAARLYALYEHRAALRPERRAPHVPRRRCRGVDRGAVRHRLTRSTRGSPTRTAIPSPLTAQKEHPMPYTSLTPAKYVRQMKTATDRDAIPEADSPEDDSPCQ